MNFTEEQIAFRDSVRRMALRHVAPIAAEIDENDRFPAELIPIFGGMGLMQIWVPEKYGGPEGNLTMVCLAREEIARHSEACALLAGINTMFALPLMHFGTEEQRQHMLYAKTGDRGGIEDISAFIIEPRKMEGITFGRSERKMGLKGQPNVPIFLDNVRVPALNLVGEEGKGFKASMRSLDLNRPTIAAASVGLAQGAFDAALEYAKQRKQFKRNIAEFQGIQFMLADMAMQIEAARALVYECAQAGDNADYQRLSYFASMAKCFASDMAMKVTTDAVQIFGGYGYVKDFPVERMMRDAKINQIFEGTNQIQRIVIARHLLS